MANGNPFYVEPGANFAQGLQGLAGSVQQTGEQMRIDQERDRILQGRQRLSEAVQAGDVGQISSLMAEYPELRQSAEAAFGFTNEQTRQIAGDTYRRALSETDPQRRTQIMQEGIQQVQQAGGTPRMMTSDLQMLQQNPEAFDKAARAGYAALASPQEYEAMFGAAEGQNIGQYNPRDYTVESFSEFRRTGDPGVLERYEAQRSVDIGGVPHIYDPASGKYRPASVMRGESGEQARGEEREVTTEDVAESEAEITRRTEQAKQEVKAESPEEQRKRQEQIEKTQEEVARARDITRQVEGLVQNPGYIDSLTGTMSALPAIPGTEKYDAKIAFERLKDTLTLGNLDKMSGVLSESDIRILQSAAGGLEQGMSREAFQSRLERIRDIFSEKSREEQRRLSEMMGDSGQQSEAQGGSGSEPETVNWSDL